MKSKLLVSLSKVKNLIDFYGLKIEKKTIVSKAIQPCLWNEYGLVMQKTTTTPQALRLYHTIVIVV